MVTIHEPINVWVFFKNGTLKPYSFFWKNRQIKVMQVNLIHTSKDGSSIFYHFSVTAQANFYRLAFDSTKLKWFLEAVEES